MSRYSNKEKANKVINAVAAVAAILFLAGAMIAIWIGLVGVKILLSAVVLFAGDWVIWIGIKNRDEKKENERGRRQA